MTSSPDQGDKIYALVDYADTYVQPLILAAVKKHVPADRLVLVETWDELPSKSAPVLQFRQYEAINFEHVLQHPSTSLANAYIIRKALIRKHYLSTTVANWVVKHPDSILKKCVKQGVEFEVDYAEFLDDALVEAWELHESWRRGGEWWILKPGMGDRGQGIRLFSSEEQLTSIFQEWDPESDEDDEDDEDARSDAGNEASAQNREEEEDSRGIVTSHLRHFIAQPYIHPPFLLRPPNSPATEGLRKFHIRTYVLAIGALKVYVYRQMLALFAARPYTPPSSSANTEEDLRMHLTNTCLQDTGEREGSVATFWALPNDIPEQPSYTSTISANGEWKVAVFEQICKVTGEVFEAAARSSSIHFQPLPNAFELFGLDFMVGVESDGELRTWLLEVNAFPDFAQTGEDCKSVVEGLMEGVVEVGIKPFLGLEGRDEGNEEGLVKVLDVDLGRR